MYNGKMETIYESEYMNLYDLQYREGGHYYCASRRNKDRMVALTPDEECGTMQPDAVSCFVVLNIKGQPKKLLLNWEYRYPVGQGSSTRPVERTATQRKVLRTRSNSFSR